MSEPWYQTQGPTSEEVKNLLLDHFTNKDSKYKITNIKFIEKYINDLIKIENEKYGGFGSYRGYYTFTHNNLIKKIINELEKES